MSMAPTAAEVERAKSQLKASTLLTLTDDGTKSIVEDIARNIFTHGTRLTPQEIEEAIDAVTPEDISRVSVSTALAFACCVKLTLCLASLQREGEALGPGHRPRRHGSRRGSVRLVSPPLDPVTSTRSARITPVIALMPSRLSSLSPPPRSSRIRADMSSMTF